MCPAVGPAMRALITKDPGGPSTFSILSFFQPFYFEASVSLNARVFAHLFSLLPDANVSVMVSMFLTSSCWISEGVFALKLVSTCCSDLIIFRKPLILLWASSRYLRTHPTAAPCPSSCLSLGSLQLSLASASSCQVVFQL